MQKQWYVKKLLAVVLVISCLAFCSSNQVRAMSCKGHKYKVLSITPSTCTDTGVEVLICTKCKSKKKVKLSKLSHKYKSISIQDATCTKDGKQVKQCTVCKKKQTTIFKKKGHSYIKEIIKKAGYDKTSHWTEESQMKCSACGKITKAVKSKTEEHTLETSILTASTCSVEGNQVTKCTKCGYKTAVEKIPKLAHTCETEVIKDAGHDDETHWTSETQEKCKVCGSIVQVTKSVVEEHDFVYVDTKAATGVAPRTDIYECTVCGARKESTDEGTELLDVMMDVVAPNLVDNEFGYKWVSGESGNYQSALNGQRKVTCVSYVAFGLQEIGDLPTGKWISAKEGTGQLSGGGATILKKDPNYQVITNINVLVKNYNDFKVGDIVGLGRVLETEDGQKLYSHVMVFAGLKNGVKTWVSLGGGKSELDPDDQTFLPVIGTIRARSGYDSYTVGFIIRKIK